MEKKIIKLEMLSENRVYIVKNKVISIDDTEYIIGENERVAYDNSSDGRLRIKNEVAEPYYSAIMSIFGDTPTVIATNYSAQ